MLNLIKKSDHWAAMEHAGSPVPFSVVLAHAATSRLAGLEMSRVGCIHAEARPSLGVLAERNDVTFIPAADLLASYPVPGSPEELDAIFSAGWLSSVPNDRLVDAVDASTRKVRRGGLVLHTLEFIIENTRSPYWTKRFAALVARLDGVALSPLGEVMSELAFSCDAATMSDSDLFNRRKKAPEMDALRIRGQTVGLVLAGRRP